MWLWKLLNQMYMNLIIVWKHTQTVHGCAVHHCVVLSSFAGQRHWCVIHCCALLGQSCPKANAVIITILSWWCCTSFWKRGASGAFRVRIHFISSVEWINYPVLFTVHPKMFDVSIYTDGNDLSPCDYQNPLPQRKPIYPYFASLNSVLIWI